VLYDTVVIGGGIAGLTAALFAARRGLTTLLLVSDVPGGHLCNVETIEDFPGFPTGVPGYELIPALQEQAENAGAELRPGEALALARRHNVWESGTNDGYMQSRTVVIASGSRFRSLGVPGEDRLRDKGVSHCAACDGPLLADRPAAVVGGGDSALQEAILLAAMDLDVHVLHREAEPDAQQAYLRRIPVLARMTFHGRVEIEEIVGTEGVEGVRYREQDSAEAVLLPVGAVFIYAGLEPNTSFLRGTVELDDSGHIPTDIWMRTALPGLFAAGDVRSNSASQAVTAAGDGATAAIAAHAYLRDREM
jgi:thioredoxin reductase (NADPH)